MLVSRTYFKFIEFSIDIYRSLTRGSGLWDPFLFLPHSKHRTYINSCKRSIVSTDRRSFDSNG